LSSVSDLSDRHESDAFFQTHIPSVQGLRDPLYSESVYNFHQQLNLTRPVDEVLNIVRTHHVVLIGVSGAGKTRTCFDISRQEYTLYIDCHLDFDFLHMLERFIEAQPELLSEQEQYRFEKLCFDEFTKFLLCRLLSLNSLIERQKVTNPFDWFSFQRSFQSQEAFVDFKYKLRLPGSDLTAILRTLARKFSVKVIFDESQVLLQGPLKNSFRSFNEPVVVNRGELVSPRSVYTFLASVMMIDLKVKSIWSGTHLRLRNIGTLVSAAGFKDELFKVFYNFNYLNVHHISRLLRLYLNVDMLSQQTRSESLLLPNICYQLQGRPRFFFSFLKEVINLVDMSSPDERLSKAIDSYYSKLTTYQMDQIDGKGSLFMFWKLNEDVILEPFEQPDNVKSLVLHELISLIATFVLSGSRHEILVDFQQDIISTSLVMVEDRATNRKCRMAEPAVLESGLNFLSSLNGNVLVDYFCRLIFNQMISSQERGKLVELLFILRCKQGWWKAGSEFIPEELRRIPIPEGFIDCQTGHRNSFYFIENLINQQFDKILLPPEKAGPDVTYKNLCCYFKTTWQRSAIPSAISDQNTASADYTSWFQSQRELNDRVIQEVKALELADRLIHLCVELPFASSESHLGWQEGPHKSRLLRIDLSHPLCKIIFSQKFVESYLKLVPK
jgi:hypothetical protein